MLDMFDDYVPDAAGERSRATMMTVLGMAEAKRYPIVIVENVVEVSRWEMFEVWLAGFTALGYQHQILSVSAAHIWSERNAPAPQWRDRIYFVFYLEGIEFPDVSPRPWGHCEACGADVRLMQSWKKPGRPIGKYRSQYVYRCPVLGHPIAEPYVMPALDALDLSDLGTRIGDRKRPLSAATMRRIRTGALMFNREPEIVAHTGHTWDATKKGHRRYGDPNGYHRVWPAADPLMARTSGPGDAIVHPHITTLNHGGGDGRTFDPAAAPLPTRSTKLGEALVTPFISHQYGAVKGSEYRNSDPASTPLGTITAGGGHHNLVTPPVGITLRKNAAPYRVDEAPTATMAARGGHHGIASVDRAFVSRQYTQKGSQRHLNTPLSSPLHAITGTGGNHALVTPTRRPKISATSEEIDAVDVSDYRFRMLQWREHANAQRFPRDYRFTGNSGVNTLLAGNAVATNVACYLGLLARVALRDLTATEAGLEWLENS
jgi:DNA (cytosine-5)-methyltransferase 1